MESRVQANEISALLDRIDFMIDQLYDDEMYAHSVHVRVKAVDDLPPYKMNKKPYGTDEIEIINQCNEMWSEQARQNYILYQRMLNDDKFRKAMVKRRVKLFLK